ncbi:MAG: hypothetical protein IPJ94_27835 [Chloroflexi bacterium]|nr:hypothetical protein [Chloroflexota bacterium]
MSDARRRALRPVREVYIGYGHRPLAEQRPSLRFRFKHAFVPFMDGRRPSAQTGEDG